MNPSRRAIVVAPIVLATGCAMTRWYRVSPDADRVIHVPLTALDADGSVSVTTGREDILVRRADDGSFSAIALTCTHQGCGLSQRRQQLVCACHGSRFDLRGNVVHGPAIRALEVYSVSADETMLHIDLGSS